MALTSVMAKHLTNKHKGGIRVCLLIKSHEEKAFGFAVHCRNSRPDKARSFVICNVASGSPAERSAVRRGDRILGVEGASVFDEPYKATVQRLKAAHGQLSMILLVAEPEAFAEYSALGLPMNALLPGAVVVIGEHPSDTERESSHERKSKHRDTSLDDAESVDEVINYFATLPQEEDEPASKYDKLLSRAGEGTSSSKKWLFTRLRRILRRRHDKTDDRGRSTSSTTAEREDCAVTSLPLAVEREECAMTSLPLAADCAVTSLPLVAGREDCRATSNPTYGREHHDISLEDDAESVDEFISYLDAPRSPEEEDELETKYDELQNTTDEGKPSSKKSLSAKRMYRKTDDRGCSTSSNAAELEECAATSLSLPAEREACIATSLPLPAEHKESGATSLSLAAEHECGATSLSLAAEHECGATSLPLAAEHEECGATPLPPADKRKKCGATLSPFAHTRSVKQPLIERIHRMLSRLGHHKKHHKCTSLISEGTSFPPAAEPAECEATLTPTFISTLSIRLKPAQLRQQKHLLYQLLADRSLKTLLT
jgi:hypothetical protein